MTASAVNLATTDAHSPECLYSSTQYSTYPVKKEALGKKYNFLAFS